MNDPILSLLGLCRRAGRMSIGCDPVKSSILKGETRLVLFAGDISKNTEKDIKYLIEEYHTDLIRLNSTKDEIGTALGKYASVVSINDAGFAKKIKKLCSEQQDQRGGM